MKASLIKKAGSAVLAAAIAANCSVVGTIFTATAAELTYEFEDSNCTSYTGDIQTTTEGLFMRDSGTITLTVSVETTGSYDLVFYSYGDGGSKQQNIYVNDVSAGILSIPAGSDYVACEMPAITLKAGTNTIAIEKSWGWSYFDKLVVEEAVLPDIIATDIVCSDPDIIPEAQSLMNYMASVYGEHIISGQQEIYMYGPHDFEYEFEYLKNLTGKYPAVRGFDYLNEANILYGNEDGTSDRIIDWVKNRNGIATASWHVTVPKDFTNFVLGETKVDWSQATYAPKDTDFDTSQILVEGSKEREYYMACLEDLAASLQKLEDENVPLIFRPLHEAEGGGGETGSWFFWGQDGSAVYKELWRLTYDTLVKDYGLHNLIWEWNSYNFATSADWYPGDDYVDIIGYDKYSCTDWSTGSPVLYHNDSSYASTFYGIMEKYNSTKMVAMAENDSFSTLENITVDKAGWLYFCTWYDGGTDSNGNSVDFVSDPIFNTEQDTIDMYQSDYCITLDELPADLYSTEAPPVVTTTTDPNVSVTTTTTTVKPEDGDTTTTTVPEDYVFVQFGETADISGRTEDNKYEIVITIEGEPSASVGGGVGYGTSPADWVNIEWSGNIGADGTFTAIVPIDEIPVSFETAEVQVWWSNLWDAASSTANDVPCEITNIEVVTDGLEPTVPTTDGDEDIVYGDADGNGFVELNDAVKIMCYVTDEANNPMTDEELDAADVYQRGDGVNNMDALAIQKKLAQLIPELPESYLEVEAE